jgi:hypothetical protein
MSVEADEASGDVFVAFDGDVATRSFTAFLTTQSGRVVQAVLHPAPGEGQTVLVRLEAAVAAAQPVSQVPRSDLGSGQPPPSRPEGRSAYQETLTQFIRVMWNGQDVEGVTHRDFGGQAMKAGPFSIRQVSAWDAAVGLHGRILYVTNLGKTDQPLVLDAFLVERVYAIAASHDALRPGEVGRILIVEEAR